MIHMQIEGQAREKAFGASHLKSHRNLDASTYRSDGIWLPGRPGNLMRMLEALPGVDARWEDVQDKRRPFVGLLRPDVQCEKSIEKQFSILSDRILQCIRLDCYLDEASEIPKGVFGVAAFSERNDGLSIGPPDPEQRYLPLGLAFVGKCDSVFTFGEGSGSLKGRSTVAIIEFKMLRQREIGHYNRHNDALCAQIHSSFLGSDARVGFAVGNGLFKIFWREKVGEFTYLYTYPAGNDMADLANESQMLILGEAVFHVARCSIIAGEDDRELLPVSVRVGHLTEERTDITPPAPRELPKIKRHKTERIKRADGQVMEVQAVDFSLFSREQLNSLIEDIKQDEEINKAMDESKPLVVGLSALSTIDMTNID
jgi:hypothetical protein